MKMKSKSYKQVYFGLWLRLVTVTAVSAWLYYEIVSFMGTRYIPGIFEYFGLEKTTEHWLVFVLVASLYVLFCWRAIKVVVLLGSPFRFGMDRFTGTEFKGASGRPVYLVSIGEESSSSGFYFGAIFKAHQKSDKLLRSRTETIILYIPIVGSTLLFLSGNLYWEKWNHSERSVFFTKQRAKYFETKRLGSEPEDLSKKTTAELAKISSSLYAIQGNIEALTTDTEDSFVALTESEETSLGIERDEYGCSPPLTAERMKRWGLV